MSQNPCLTELISQTETPDLYTGTGFTIPGTQYSIEVVDTHCGIQADFSDYYTTIKILKSGVQIAQESYYLGGTHTRSYDMNELCVHMTYFNCQTPGAPFTGYTVYFGTNPYLNATHVIDVRFSPFPWYTASNMLDYATTILADINGKIISWAAGNLIGYTYLGSQIVLDGKEVIVRAYLQQTDDTQQADEVAQYHLRTLGIPTIVALLLLASVLAGLLIRYGLPLAVGFYDWLTGLVKQEKKIGSKDLPGFVFGDPANPDAPSITPIQLNKCDTDTPEGQCDTLLICYNSVIEGACDGTVAKLIEMGVDMTGYSCPDVTPKLQECCTQYTIDNDWDKVKSCMRVQNTTTGQGLTQHVTDALAQQEKCWISNPTGGCILSAAAGKTILIGTSILVGGYLLFRLIKK